MFRPILFLFLLCCLASASEGYHLFILSGQSNMAQQPRPSALFIPRLAKHIPESKIIAILDAEGGQPISRWYKDWQPAEGEPAHEPIGDLYDRLMGQVRPAIENKKLASVTFVWMQGESDAGIKHNSWTVYEKSLLGLVKQFETDLNWPNMHVVLGRISDFVPNNTSPYAAKRNPGWLFIRELQVKLCENNPRWGWVDTDSYNGDENKLHYTAEGRSALAEAFADKAYELLNANGRL